MKNNASNDKEEDISGQIVENSPVPTFVLDRDHKVVHWNKACEVVSGVKAADMIGTDKAWSAFYKKERPTMADLVVDGEIDRIHEIYKGKYHRSKTLEDTWEAEDFFEHFPDGGKWLAFSARPLKDKGGNVIGAVETLRDVTLRKLSQIAIKENEHLLSEVVEGSPVPTLVIDKDHKVTHWNKACESIFGISAQDIIGTKDHWKPFYTEKRPIMADLVLDGRVNEVSQYYKGIWAASGLIEGGWEATDYFPNFTTGPKWLFFTAAPLHNANGELVGAIETLQDVSGQKKYEEKLEFQANHDALTGLANRNLLTDRMNQAIAHAKRNDKLLALLFIDLDNFKTVNDTLGHNVGDQLICRSAEKISKCVRTGDTVSRLGGDEFVVLLYDPDNEDHVTDIVQRISQKVATSYKIKGQDLHVSCSVGVALYPQDGETVDELMKNADSAMYLAKGNERGGFCFFTQDLNDRAFLRLQIENDLHKAVRQQQFEVLYQPIYDLKSSKIIAAEALLRWNHPDYGVINPMEFISIAEEIGLIVPIGEWVLRTAAEEALYWCNELNVPLRISVNVSARQFHNNEIHEALTKVFDTIGRPSFDIELELTENMVMRNPEEAEEHLDSLRDLGVQLAMDDFGTGYSSLAYLRRFPFDMIKIDKAFVNDLGHNIEAEAIVRAMLELGRALGLRMLAEGVETDDQRRFLLREGCDEMQGFLFSKPVSKDQIRKMLVEQNSSLP